MRNLLRNSSGSAQIIAVLAATAVGAIVMVTNATMFNAFNKQNRDVMQTHVALDLRKQVENFLADPANCAASLLGKNSGNDYASANDGFKRAVTNEVAFAPGLSTMEQGMMQFAGYNITETDTIIDTTAATYRQILDLNLVLTKLGANNSGTGSLLTLPGNAGGNGNGNGNAGGNNAISNLEMGTIKRTIKIAATRTGPGGNIVNCYAITANSNELWARDAGGTNIYPLNWNTGNVGIGTNNPTEKFDVLGNALFRVDSTPTSGDVTAQNIIVTGNTNAAATPNQLILVGNASGIGKNSITPGFSLDVLGNSLISGDMTITGTLTTGNLATIGNFSTTGNMTVLGSTNMNTMQASGAANFGSTSTFSGNSMFLGPVIMNSSVGVNGYNPPPGNIMGVGGNATVSGVINTSQYSASSQICINGNCRTTFATQTCPAGQVIRQLNVNGTITCVNVTCASNELFKGFSGAGTPICEDLPLNMCPAGQMLETINPATGVKTCKAVPPNVDVASCPAGQYLTSISNGTGTCSLPQLPGGLPCAVGQVGVGFDLYGRVTCGSPVRGTPLVCPVGQVARGIASNGTPICSSPYDGLGCPAGQIATGIDANGSMRCSMPSMLTGGSCAAGSIAVGVQADGAPVCGCPATIFSWVASGTTCDGSTTSRYAGASVTIVDTAGTTTGQATYSCQADGTWNMTPSATTCAGPTPAPPPTGPSMACACYYSSFDSQCSSGINLSVDVFNIPESDCTSQYSQAGGQGSNCRCEWALTCPAQPINWTVGANTCSSSISQKPVNINRAVVDSTGGFAKGSVSLFCNSSGTWVTSNPVCNY